jgi:hypothetical protein
VEALVVVREVVEALEVETCTVTVTLFVTVDVTVFVTVAGD